jgi:hypothetical protein
MPYVVNVFHYIKEPYGISKHYNHSLQGISDLILHPIINISLTLAGGLTYIFVRFQRLIE